MKYLCRRQKSQIRALNSSKIELLDNNYLIDLTALEEDFCFRHKASIKFLIIVNDIITRDIMKQFQDHTADVIKYLDHICCYYSCFINPTQLKHISEKDPIIIAIEHFISPQS